MTDKTEGQRSPDHPYNAPGLCPLQFLQAVYHDPTVDIGLRILAYVLGHRPEPMPSSCDDETQSQSQKKKSAKSFRLFMLFPSRFKLSVSGWFGQ